MNNLKLMPLLKNNSQHIFGLFLTLTTFSLPLTSNVIAQENSESSTQSNQPEIKSTTVTREKDKSILATIWKLLRVRGETEPPLTSRSIICEITPGLLEKTSTIYSDRPLFIWKGTVASLEINLYSPYSLDADQEVIWSKTVNGKSQNILYTGEPLQPGKTYDWEIIIIGSQAKPRRAFFEVMEQEERDLISGELAQLETDLTISGATKEEIILAKANYFAEKDLWSDSLQQLYSLENSSTVVKDSNQKIASYLCEGEKRD